MQKIYTRTKTYSFSFFTLNPVTGEPGTECKFEASPLWEGDEKEARDAGIMFIHLGLARGVLCDPNMWDLDGEPDNEFMWEQLDRLAAELPA